MVCCLMMTPSHNPNQSWLIITGVLLHSLESNFTRKAHKLQHMFRHYNFKIITASSRGQWGYSPFYLCHLGLLHWHKGSLKTDWMGIILCIHPANVRWRYIVASSLIGWVHTQNHPGLKNMNKWTIWVSWQLDDNCNERNHSESICICHGIHCIGHGENFSFSVYRYIHTLFTSKDVTTEVIFIVIIWQFASIFNCQLCLLFIYLFKQHHFSDVHLSIRAKIVPDTLSTRPQLPKGHTYNGSSVTLLLSMTCHH